MGLIVGILALYFAGLLVGLLVTRRPAAARGLMLFRSWFPSWRFFDTIGQTPRLVWRWQMRDGWSDWQALRPRATRQWWHLFYNPATNLALAEQTLVEQLAQDLARLTEGAEAADLTAYQLIERLAREKAAAECAGAPFQFAIAVHRRGSPLDVAAGMVLLSPVLDG